MLVLLNWEIELDLSLLLFTKQLTGDSKYFLYTITYLLWPEIGLQPNKTFKIENLISK